MDKLLRNMANDVILHDENIMLATNDPLTEHLSKLSKVLQFLKEGYIKIRQIKLKIAQTTVNFLRLIWRKDTIFIS